MVYLKTGVNRFNTKKRTGRMTSYLGDDDRGRRRGRRAADGAAAPAVLSSGEGGGGVRRGAGVLLVGSAGGGGAGDEQREEVELRCSGESAGRPGGGSDDLEGKRRCQLDACGLGQQKEVVDGGRGGSWATKSSGELARLR